MALQKFVVLIVVLIMILGVTVYTVLDSDLFVHESDVVTVDEKVSNTVNN